MKAEASDQTKVVLQHHMRAFVAADLEATMVDYDEHAILIHPDGVQRGHEQIRAFFEQIFKGLPASATQKLVAQTVEGQIAYIVWSGESEQLHIPYATDTFVIRDGKIAVQTFAGLINQKEA